MGKGKRKRENLTRLVIVVALYAPGECVLSLSSPYEKPHVKNFVSPLNSSK
jgi:hypothetical protein